MPMGRYEGQRDVLYNQTFNLDQVAFAAKGIKDAQQTAIGYDDGCAVSGTLCIIVLEMIHMGVKEFEARWIGWASVNVPDEAKQRALTKALAEKEGGVVWCHDYHLMFLPKCLKEHNSDMKFGWFLHTPFPSSEIHRTLPSRSKLLHAVLAFDLVGNKRWLDQTIAAEHIASGMPVMVVETVFPGPPDEHTTVSTRLFLPARKVKEKAKKLKSYLTEDILSNTTSRNILAMTFRQVQVTASFALNSSDELVISLLGEVVCLAALESTERHFLRNSLGRTSNNFFYWFHKSESIASTDSSVTIYKLFDDEILASAKSLLETFNSKKGNYKPSQSNVNYSWWTLPIYSKLEKIGGLEFITRINECQSEGLGESNVLTGGDRNPTKSKIGVLLVFSSSLR
ncbi:hypothetical protein TEA_014619 [Camellia sinensis var. sinensis]|uniref:Uncharacterized protein n=1 Tax=Camellia sinensis var. sinensis TaxID=542762 RepID=A0A4S4E336_CAMSN|nr:hypothetical protein TEA_014619 [Camellia sinensis var. sinensis]